MIREKVLSSVNQGIVLGRIERVLVIRLDEIGDVILTVPFLRELRRNLPDAWITLVVKPAVYNIVELCPYVNEVLTYNWNMQGYWEILNTQVKALRLASKCLRNSRFDLAIVPRWDLDYYNATFLTYFSGARRRLGYSEFLRRRNFGRYVCDKLFTDVLYSNQVKHEVEHNLDVLRFLGGDIEDDRLELWISGEDELFSRELLVSAGVDSNNLLISLAPGARAPKRRWPMERFIEIGLWIRNTYNAKFIVVGGDEDKELGEELFKALGDVVINATGRTTLRQTCALLKNCDLFIGNDSGPMHMAAAMRVPVIEISCHPKSGSPWSSNAPQRFGPWRVPHIVVQPDAPVSPCYGECRAGYPHCILGVSIDEVKRAVERLFAVGGRAEVICKIRSKC